MNGITTKLSHLSRTKDHADHAGPSPLLDLCNPTGTFLEKERTLPSQSSNLLIVLVILIIMDAMEVFPLMPSNTSSMQVDSNLTSPIHTLPRMDSVFSDVVFL